jgi:energy-coupling factor transporter transmembrane protein EcfT
VNRFGPIIALIIIIVVPFIFWSGGAYRAPSSKLIYWIIAMVSLVAFILIVGYALRGVFFAALIDERNKMSLSRMQLFLWTVIIISGYFTAVMWNLLMTDKADPLAVQLPQELWWLLGISTTSFVGTPLIQSTKTNQQPQTPAMQAIANRSGVLGNNAQPQDARFANLFQGDEVGNENTLDMGKVQMFFFTIIIVVAYVMILGGLLLTTTGPVEEFPALSESILVLLGISHAGYLVYKAAPHTPTAP